MKRLAACALLAFGCGRAVDTSWHQEPGYRWRALDVPRRGTPGFTPQAPSHTGVAFTNSVGDSLLLANRILAQGAGVCLGDVDGDGRPDIFLARTAGPSALYRNLGDWRFEDVTPRAGVAAADRHSSGCALADVDGDGDLDLILAAIGGPNALFVNDGTGRFTEQRLDAAGAGSTTIAVADVDGDGDLDVYIANYKAYTTIDRMAPLDRAFDRIVRRVGRDRYEVREEYRRDYKLVEREDRRGVTLVQRADPDFFYRNDGAGRYTLEPPGGNPRFAGAASESFGLAALFADVNGDGAPDLYVVNDFEDPDEFWLNDGHGRFRLAPWYTVRATSNSGMAVDVGDVDRDGTPDLFEVDMLARDTRRLKTEIPTHTATLALPGLGEDRPQRQRNTLQLNRGDGTFAEGARLTGLGATGWSWSTLLLDVDLDGWEDVLVGTGHRWDVMDGDTQLRLRGHLQSGDWRHWLFEYPSLALPNVAFRNRGDLTFEDASRAWRFDLGADISHGMAHADLDGDGDPDVVINRADAPAALLRNDATAPRIAIRLHGEPPNTAGIGARVAVRGGAVPLQAQEMRAGGSYLSSSDAELTVATGRADSVTIDVTWRDGRRSVIPHAVPNRLYEIDERTAVRSPTPHTPRTTPLFEDVSAQLAGHRHVEPFFDDYARQLLLPNAFSQLGPGVAWADLDGDGREDLIVGTGRTGRLAWFLNAGGRLRPAPTRVPAAVGDLTTVIGAAGRVIAGMSSYEMTSDSAVRAVPGVVAYAPGSGALTPLVPGSRSSVGPLAMADYDGDGNLDLFVGGRIIPGGYPLAPESHVLRGVGGAFVPDSANDRALAGVGMVSAALFSDLNGDGWPDLILAVEWGPIRVFLNDHGRLAPAEFPGLTGVPSRWNGVATGDLDGDGRLDVVATSWGRNTDYHVSADRPLVMSFGRFGPGGRPSLVLAQRDTLLMSFQRFAAGVPGGALRLRTFAAFADATVEQALGPVAPALRTLQATTLDHTLFLNRGDHFEARPLPALAQMAPAFYAGIADFDGDGNEDLFLSQNCFATDLETPRYDAGRSLLLLGDGKGGLGPIPGQRSGLIVYGEQRGAAYADFDGDGRLDLAVSQNGAGTKLFHNVGAAAGVRVRLIGASGNRTAVGAQLRLRYGERSGPVREVQAGSGYWSQNGAVQVLGLAGEPIALWIRWPGGKEQVVSLARGQRAVSVAMP